MNITVITGCVLALIVLPAVAGDRPTEPFRREHVEVKKHLDHLDQMIGGLPAAAPADQRATMAAVVRFLDEHIRKHAEWEETALYPAVDRRTHAGSPPFTASMRHEHRIVGRSIDELAAMASASQPDVTAFARSADRLLGVISAHFEKEEEVLLPILDATMTAAEFESELGHGAEENAEASDEDHDHR